jgi:GDP-4-dehydro-6-deoxy-D-mannose reductase
MKKALITGCNGFVGKWLTDFLNAKRIETFGIDLQDTCLHHSIVYRKADIQDVSNIKALVSDIKPDFIFNLAGVTFLPDADASPKAALDANISGIMILLDAIRIYVPTAQLLIVGSSKEYPDKIECETISECNHPQPNNFYGISKYISELVGLQYHRQFGIDVRCTRSFNHTGPGQSSRFVCSEWTRQIAAITLGLSEPVISVGNMDVIIDFSDVRDVVAAYYQIMTQGKPGEIYNVCSGKDISLQWILNYLVEKSPHAVTIHHREEKRRINESSVRSVGTYAKLHEHTGWKPSIGIEQTLDDLYSWWLEKLKT